MEVGPEVPLLILDGVHRALQIKGNLSRVQFLDVYQGLSLSVYREEEYIAEYEILRTQYNGAGCNLSLLISNQQ